MAENTPALIYAVGTEIIPGPYPERPDNASIGWYNLQFPVPVLTKREQEQILFHGRVALHHTYSMQQTDFARIGCELSAEGRVFLPVGSYVVGIAARDRYDIFVPVDGLTVVTYESAKEWRFDRDAEREGWTI